MTNLRTILLLLCSFTMSLRTFSQNVTITPDGITPALSSSYQRLTYDAIVALPSPNDGDIAYDVTFKCMRLYNGTKWVRLISDDDLNIPSATGWSAGGIGADEAYAIATDTSGNIFVTGYFRNTATFGDTSVISAGGQDVFIAKYNSSGTLQWIETAGGTSDEVGLDIAVDTNGDIYITGSFIGVSNFSGTTISSINGSTDAFIVKYSKQGSFIWIQQGGGSNADSSISIAIDSTNNVYITGHFNTAATFGLANITSTGADDIFIAKYNVYGSLQWIQKTGGVNVDVGMDIDVDKEGKVLITGYFVGNTTIGNNSFSGSGGSDVFLAKYNPFISSWDWSVNGVGSGDDNGLAITTDASGNVYLSGHFGNTLNLYGTILSNTGILDIFIAKFTSNGVLAWARRAGGSLLDASTDLLVDNNGNIYITGYFSETATFDNITLISNGQADVFVAKYNNAGVLQWVQKAGDILIDYAYDLAIDNQNNIYVAGMYQNKINFGNAKLTSTGGQDIFIARIKE